MLPPSPSSTPSTARRRPRNSFVVVAATAVAIAFASGPAAAHASADGGLRGTDVGSVVDPPSAHQPQHEEARPVERELAPRGTNKPNANPDGLNVVDVDPFTAYLLRMDFPYQPGHNDANSLTGKIEAYLAPILNEATGTTVVNLGLTCAKDEGRVGIERRWVLDCSGRATFDEMPKRGVVNAAINTAFADERKDPFLAAMYPNYKIVHETEVFKMLRHGGHNSGHTGQKEQKRKKDQKNKRKRKNAQKKRKDNWKKNNQGKDKDKHHGKNHHHHGQGGKNNYGGKRPRKPTMQQLSSAGGDVKNSGLNSFGYDSALAKPNPDKGYAGGSVSSNGDIIVQAQGN